MNDIRLVDYIDILNVPSLADSETRRIYEAMREMALKHATIIVTPKHRPQDSFSGQSVTFNDLFVDKREHRKVSIDVLKRRPSTEAFEFGIIDTEIKIS